MNDTKKIYESDENRIIQFLNYYNAKEKNLILPSIKNDYLISTALIIRKITSSEYIFKLAIVNDLNYKIISRSVYELEDKNIILNKSTWDNNKQEYIYKVNRTENEKIIAFALEIQEPETGEIIRIISNDYLIKPQTKKIKASIDADEKNETQIDNIVTLKANDLKYLDSIKIVWQKKYDINGIDYSDIETTNFVTEKKFNKEICGKYIRAKFVESILAPIGLYANGIVKYHEFLVDGFVTNDVYIRPGIFSGYKLVGTLLKEHKILLLSEFQSNNSQKESDFKIAWWESRTNNKNWVKYETQSKRMMFKYSKNDKVEFRFVYFLSAGTSKDAMYSNTLIFESLIKSTKIIRNDNKVLINLPRYINKYDVKYDWYVRYKDESEFHKLENDKNYVSLNSDMHLVNATYKVILNYRDLYENIELISLPIENKIIDEEIEIKKIASFDDLINVKAIIPFDGESDVHIVWGEKNKIIETKQGSNVSFYRDLIEREYWVYATSNNKITKKQHFHITESFKPNVEFVTTWPLVTANIGNKYLDENYLIFNWQKSIDGQLWEDILNVDSNTIDVKSNNIHFGFLRVKIKYKEMNDIYISDKIKIK